MKFKLWRPLGVVIALMFMASVTQLAHSAVGLTDLEGKQAHFSDYAPSDKWLVVMIWS